MIQEFKQRIYKLAADIPNQRNLLTTEEATKHTLILPFLTILGYNVFDSQDITPEFTADTVGKKGEKVDYALKKDGRVIAIIECKPVNVKLEQKHIAQLARYFTWVDDAVVGILTNGIIYRFYIDSINPNKLDDIPFLEVSLLNLNDQHIQDLALFIKNSFNPHEIKTRADDLIYGKKIQEVMIAELNNPSDNFVKFFLPKISDVRRQTQSTIQRFSPLIKQALHQLFRDPPDQLKAVLTPPVNPETKKKIPKTELVPSEQELIAYDLIKTLVKDVINPSHITLRKNYSYCGVLLDDNNRRTICRLYFDRPQKYLGLFDETKQETRVPINSLQNLELYVEQLKASIRFFDTGQISDNLNISPIDLTAAVSLDKEAEDKIAISHGTPLRKGGNIALNQLAPNITSFAIGLRWAVAEQNIDIDSSAFLVGNDNKVLSDKHFVFFNNLASPDGSVQHLGNNKGNQGDNETLYVNLDKVSPEVKKIIFTVTIYDSETRQQDFNMVDNAVIRIINRTNEQCVAYYDLSEDTNLEAAMIFGEFYRYRDEWKFRAVGQGFQGGLAAMSEYFGVNKFS